MNKHHEANMAVIGPLVADERPREVAFIAHPCLLDLVNRAMSTVSVFSGNSKSHEAEGWKLIQTWAFP